MVRMTRPKSSISGGAGGFILITGGGFRAFRFMGGGLRETFSREAKQFRLMGAMSGAKAGRFIYHDSSVTRLRGEGAEQVGERHRAGPSMLGRGGIALPVRKL